MKRIFKDGKFYGMRRGELVEIPEKWVGKIPTNQTIRKRKSKMGGRRTRKNKNKST